MLYNEKQINIVLKGGIQMTNNVKHKSSKLMKGIRKLTKCKTFKNKVYAILLLILGIVSIPVCDGDIT